MSTSVYPPDHGKLPWATDELRRLAETQKAEIERLRAENEMLRLQLRRFEMVIDEQSEPDHGEPHPDTYDPKPY